MIFNPSQDGCFIVCVDATTDGLASACDALFPGKPIARAPHQSVFESCRSGQVENDVEGRNEVTLSCLGLLTTPFVFRDGDDQSLNLSSSFDRFFGEGAMRQTRGA